MVNNVFGKYSALKKSDCALFESERTYIPKNRYLNFFFTILFLLFTYFANATIYYVSNSGNDSNSGTSESQAWRSLSKVNSFTPRSGDQILFKRGNEWFGTIKINASGTSGNPITFGAYGSGIKPIITGFTTIISGWSNEGNGIYSKNITVESKPQMVVIDGTQYAMGRWPNSTWRTITGVSGSTQISDSGLSGSPNWTGAEVVIRKRREIIDRSKITSHSSTNLYFSSTNYTAKSGWGYFIQNSLRTLDKYGEWYYDSGTSKLYVYFGSVNPDTKTVNVGSLDILVSLNRSKYINVNGISLTGSNVAAVYRSASDYSAANLFIQNCDISFSGTDGVYFQRAASITVTNTTFSNTNNNAIFFESTYGTSNNVNNCTIVNTGTIPGLSSSGDGNGIAIKTTAANSLIEYNRIINSGYIAIYYGGQNTIIRNNFIDTFCSIKDDGGGIYCFRDNYTGKKVLNNIVINAIGAFGTVSASGTSESSSSARGLYADQLSTNILYSGNTLYNISASGIHMTGVQDIIIENNTLFQTESFFDLVRIPSSDFISNLSITNNIFVSTLNNPSQIPHNKSAIWYSVNMYGSDLPYYNNDFVKEVAHFGIIDRNVYYSNTSTLAFTYSLTPSISDYIKTYYTNDSWKSKLGYDANSTFVAGNTDPSFYRFEYNATKSSKTISLSYPMVDVKGTKYNNSITLQPFTSVVLMKDLSTASDAILPVISSFSIPSTSASLTVDISSFNVSDNIGVTGYLLTETSSKPSAGASGWTSTKPSRYSFSSGGSKTLYAWAKDAAGNVSASVNDQVLITLSTPSTANTGGSTEVFNSTYLMSDRRAMPVTFNESGDITSISVYHEGGSGNLLLGVYTDQGGSPESLLEVSPTTVVNSTAGWQTVLLKSPVSVTSGQTVWLSWLFQNATEVRYTAGAPGRAISTGTWSSGMPSTFGASSIADYKYSIYCSYIPDLSKSANILSNLDSYINNLNVKEIQYATEVITISKGEIYNSWTVSGIYQRVIKTFSGTDSIVTTILNVLNDEPVLNFDKDEPINIPILEIESLESDKQTVENYIDITGINEFKLYPNPTKSFVNVDYVITPKEGTIIEIIDCNGRVVFKKQTDSNLNRINTDQFMPGLYFVKSLNKNENNVKKLIIH